MKQESPLSINLKFYMGDKCINRRLIFQIFMLTLIILVIGLSFMLQKFLSIGIQILLYSLRSLTITATVPALAKLLFLCQGRNNLKNYYRSNYSITVC